MRKTVSVLSAAVLAAAFAAPAVAETKIAVISEAALLQNAPQVAAARQKFNNEFQKREDDLKAEGKKIDQDRRKLRIEGDMMSPEQRTTAQNDLNTRITNFESKQRTFGEQVQARNNELQREVLLQVNQAIREVATEKGLDLVLRDPAFASEALDITGDVLKKLAAMPPPKAGAPAADPKKNSKKK